MILTGFQAAKGEAFSQRVTPTSLNSKGRARAKTDAEWSCRASFVRTGDDNTLGPLEHRSISIRPLPTAHTSVYRPRRSKAIPRHTTPSRANTRNHKPPSSDTIKHFHTSVPINEPASTNTRLLRSGGSRHRTLPRHVRYCFITDITNLCGATRGARYTERPSTTCHCGRRRGERTKRRRSPTKTKGRPRPNSGGFESGGKAVTFSSTRPFIFDFIHLVFVLVYRPHPQHDREFGLVWFGSIIFCSVLGICEQSNGVGELYCPVMYDEVGTGLNWIGLYGMILIVS